MINLDRVPGTASVWCGRLGQPPAYQREPDAVHYAASLMKLPVLAAAHSGGVDLTAAVRVTNAFQSVVGGQFSCTERHDSDPQVWARLGQPVPLRWLVERMIVRSSNLAANLVLAAVGLPAAAAIWPLLGARHSVLERGIEDVPAARAGRTNLVTAADLAALLGAVALGADHGSPLGSPRCCRAMLDTLLAQQAGADLLAGLPPGTRVAHKNGWVRGVRHSAGVVYPPDAPPFVLVVCLTTPLAVNDPGDEACRIVARAAAAAWSARHDL